MLKDHLKNDNEFLFAIRINGEVHATIYPFHDHGSLNMMLNACKDAALAKRNEETPKEKPNEDTNKA